MSGFAVFWGDGDVLTAELRALHEGLLVGVVMTAQDVNQYWQRDDIHWVRELLRHNWQVSVHHVPRERNMVADYFARYAIKMRCHLTKWRLPSASVVPLLCQDVLS